MALTLDSRTSDRPRASDNVAPPADALDPLMELDLKDRLKVLLGLGLSAAHDVLNVEASRRPTVETFQVTSVVRQGTQLRCECAGFFPEQVLALRPGLQLEVVTRDGRSDRTRVVRAEVTGVFEPKGAEGATPSPVLQLQLLEEGRLSLALSHGDRVELNLRPDKTIETIRRDVESAALNLGPRYGSPPRSPEQVVFGSLSLKRPPVDRPTSFSRGAFYRAWAVPDDEGSEDVRSSPTELPAPSSPLDSSQREAFDRAMQVREYPFLLIHGGPGTGKTTVLSEIIAAHVGSGRRVLVLSHSNRAVDVVGERVVDMGASIHRAGNDPRVVSPNLHDARIRKGYEFPREEFQALGSQRDGGLRRAELLRKHHERLAECRAGLTEAIEGGGVVFSTFGTLESDEVVRKMPAFDVVIVDEATRLHMPEFLTALQFARQQVIFVGDPLQLGNIPLSPQDRGVLMATQFRAMRQVQLLPGLEGVVDRLVPLFEDGEFPDTLEGLLQRTGGGSLEEAQDSFGHQLAVWAHAAGIAVAAYEEGPFSALIRSSRAPEEELPYVFLDQNRRSLPNIVHVLSGLMYGGRLKPGREAREGEPQGLVEWVDTRNIEARERSEGTSKRNPTEARVVAKMVLDRVLCPDRSARLNPEDLAVIATYAEQADCIQQQLRRSLYNNPNLLARLLPRVASVDAFQGSQSRVVIVSLTRSNTQGEVGFLREERRIGVALGRAEDELYVVGDSKTLVADNREPASQEFFARMENLIRKHGRVTPLVPQKPSRRRR